ncbi:MAG: hypothetical protein H6621_02640 [Halobacteriovoraceae bacterium]|nr:hypothetical protein [Halobacteriovoraceae bacterium]MCB9093941.1 hypothetical protein [Halobacteriovoraceae bacterium]
MNRLFYILFLFCFSKTLQAQGLLQRIETLSNSHAINSVESLQDQINPIFLEQFLWAFDSRSPIGANLEFPRQFLFNVEPENEVFEVLSYAADEEMRNGEIVEIVQFNSKTGLFDWGSWDSVNNVFRKNPPHCLKCHGGPDGTFKLIWDSYPDWIGFYGMSHNDIKYGRGKVGSSELPTHQFEEDGLSHILKNQNDYPRLKKLKIPHDLNLSEMANRNMNFGGEVYRFHAKYVNHFLDKTKVEKKLLNLSDGILRASDIKSEWFNEISNINGAKEKTKRYLNVVNRYLEKPLNLNDIKWDWSNEIKNEYTISYFNYFYYGIMQSFDNVLVENGLNPRDFDLNFNEKYNRSFTGGLKTFFEFFYQEVNSCNQYLSDK